jgi:hypothetical protein
MEEEAALPFDELVEWLDQRGKRHFADPQETARRLQAVARDSYPLVPALQSPVNLVLNLSLKNISQLESLQKRLDSAIAERMENIPNTLTTIPGNGIGVIMNKFMQWIGSIFKEAITKVLVSFFAGIILSVLSLGFITGIFNSLSNSILVPVWPLFILSLFAIVGVLAASEKIWTLIIKNRTKQNTKNFVDDELEDSTKRLLRRLTQVEVGISDSQRELRDFKADLLNTFDEWETSILPYIKEKERDQISEMRKEISNQFLPNAKDKVGGWMAFVKGMTRIAQSR